jgi:hypothetical protein
MIRAVSPARPSRPLAPFEPAPGRIEPVVVGPARDACCRGRGAARVAAGPVLRAREVPSLIASRTAPRGSPLAPSPAGARRRRAIAEAPENDEARHRRRGFGGAAARPLLGERPRRGRRAHSHEREPTPVRGFEPFVAWAPTASRERDLSPTGPTCAFLSLGPAAVFSRWRRSQRRAASRSGR